MDVIATSPRMDLEGRSSAQLLADGQVDLAVQVIRMAGMRCSPGGRVIRHRWCIGRLP